MKKKRWICLLLACLLLLPACSTGGQEPAPEPEDGVTTLIYGKFTEDKMDGSTQYWVNLFNKKHKGEVQIEIKDYTKLSEGGKQGVDLFLTEMAAGKGPDIIDLGISGESSLLPYRQMVERGYLEDLWPYLENDPKVGLYNGKLQVSTEAPLRAAMINGGLYCAFAHFKLHTLIGDRSVVGDRTGWAPEDVLEAFAAMPEGATILEDSGNWENVSVKEHFLTSLLYGFSDLFIDWEKGRCSFDGEKFRSLLELANSLPNQYELKLKCGNASEAWDEHCDRIKDGFVMLDDDAIWSFSSLWGHAGYEKFDLDKRAYVGYPVDDGSSGSYFEPTGLKLAMSSACRDKDAAWEYIRQMYTATSKDGMRTAYGICLGLKDYRNELLQVTKNEVNQLVDGEWIRFPPVPRECVDYVETIIDSTTHCSLLVDTELVDLVVESAGAYFAGDRTLDDTVRLIQNRASLYVNERR